MKDCGQWLVDNNLRYLILFFYIMCLPIAIPLYLIVAALNEVREEVRYISSMIVEDIKTICTTERSKK